MPGGFWESSETVAEEEEFERKEGALRDSTEGRRAGVDGGGGSYPGCCTPRSQMGSVHLSGVESLSRMKRMARSRWPLPCFAAERRGFGFDFGDAMWDWERMEGRERSVEEEELKVWEIQPERRVGRSDMRLDEDVEYIDTEGRMSEIVLSGRSARVRGRGESDGSTITGISSTLSSCSPSTSVPVLFSSWPDRPLRPLPGLGDTPEGAGEACEDELELAMLVRSEEHTSELQSQ